MYSIACMGGDGTVSQVVNALMNRIQKEKEVEMKHGANPVPSPLPLGIIPTGKEYFKKINMCETHYDNFGLQWR